MSDNHDLRDLFGEVIHAYTRARAIPDRALVDVSPAAHDRPPGPADLQAIFWGGLIPNDVDSLPS